MAGEDIFGLTQKSVGGQFARGDTFILRKGNVNGGGGEIIGLAQNVSVGFSRPLQQIFELGSSDVAMSSGRPQGQLNIARVIGKMNNDGGSLTLIDLLGDEFYKMNGEAKGGFLTASPLSGKSGLLQGDPTAINGPAIELVGCFVVGEQFGGSAQDVVIIESVQIQFISMSKQDA